MRSILGVDVDRCRNIKNDDLSKLGAVRIRIRSLMAAIDARKQ